MHGNDEKCVGNHKGIDHIRYLETSRGDIKWILSKETRFEILWTELNSFMLGSRKEFLRALVPNIMYMS